jgi:hypothetical protein
MPWPEQLYKAWGAAPVAHNSPALLSALAMLPAFFALALAALHLSLCKPATLLVFIAVWVPRSLAALAGVTLYLCLAIAAATLLAMG